MKLITELNIGLTTKNQEKIDPQEVVDRISRHVEAGTFYETKGLWKGELENSITFECDDIEENLKNHDTVEELKEELETVFNQESVRLKQYGSEVRY